MQRRKLSSQTADEKQQEGQQKTGKGLGDLISDITGALGIQECGGCKKRKEKFNKIRLW